MQLPPGKKIARQVLKPGEFEYDMCNLAVMKTINYHDAGINKYAKSGIGRNDQFTQNVKITRVEKVYNPCTFDRFTGELRRTLRKYPQKKIWDLVKLLFHGTNNTNPIDTLNSEYGLDNRLRQHGSYG